MRALTLYKKMDPRFRIKLGVAIISGLMLTASFPPGKLDWVAWIALVPLFWTLKNESPSRAFKLGFIAGVAHYVTLIYWIVVVLEHYGGLPYFVSFFILLIFCFYLALFPAFFSYNCLIPFYGSSFLLKKRTEEFCGI